MDNEKPLTETITEAIQEKVINPINETIKTVLSLGEAPPSDNVVDVLKADHRKVEGLFKDFENAESKAEKVDILKTILEELTLHTIAEEKLVYSKLEVSKDEDEQEKVHEAFEEHEAAQTLISQLSTFTGDEENFEAKVKVLQEMIKHHVTEEELDLLPKLDESNEELEELGREFQAEKEDLKEQNATFEPEAEAPEPVMHKPRKAAARPAKRVAATKASPTKSAKSSAKSSAKKPAKKSATKKTSAKKAVAKKSTAKKAPGKKKAPAKKAVAKKSAAKKAPAKKAVTKKSTAKKPTAKKTAVKKPALKKPAAKKATAKTASKPKKATAASSKKTPAKKATAKKATVKKPAANAKRKAAKNKAA